MFSHLTLLNHHKRHHNQDNNDNGQEAITVVTNGQNIVQTQNLVGENGQLSQIQIVATESLEPATTHAIQTGAVVQAAQGQTQDVTTVVSAAGGVTTINSVGGGIVTASTKTIQMDPKIKCLTCGNPVQQNVVGGKRKNSKIRCENCINNDNATTNVTQTTGTTATINNTGRATATQIFVAPDGDVKFEMSELPSGTSESSMDSLGGTQNIIQISPNNQQTTNNRIVVSKMNQTQQNSNATTTNNIQFAPGHHPVKKRNLATVTKCQKCNGSGVIFIGGGQRQIKTE